MSDRNLTVWEIDNFLEATFPEVPMLVDPLVATRGITILHGKGGVGKTQFAVTLSAAILHGMPFLGAYSSRKGTVVFLEVDTPKLRFQQRLKKASGLLKGQSFIPILTDSLLDVLTPSEAFKEACRGVNVLQPDLVIVDSLRKIHRMSETDDKAPHMVYDALRDLFPYSAFLILHHNRKDLRGKGHNEESDDFLGTRHWIDDADCGIQLRSAPRATKYLNANTKRYKHLVYMTFSKHRDFEEQPAMLLGMEPKTMLIEPVEPNAWHLLQEFMKEHPVAGKAKAVSYLTDNDICGKTRAYDLYRRWEEVND